MKEAEKTIKEVILFCDEHDERLVLKNAQIIKLKEKVSLLEKAVYMAYTWLRNNKEKKEDIAFNFYLSVEELEKIIKKYEK